MRRPPTQGSSGYSLYLVTDTAQCGPRGVVETVRRAVAGGVDVVQVREKGGSDRDRLALVRAVVEVCAGTGVPVLVNDAVDVAVIAGAQGVHLGQSDLPAADVRALLGPDRLLGLSISTVEELTAAPLDALDYLGVGPVHATPTKADAAAPLGAAGVAALAAAAPIACVAIGGIHPETLDPLRGSGIAGICVVSEICAAEDPEDAARTLRARWVAG